jgi:hypothetical protein
MVELKKLRGKSILVNGANAVNDLLVLCPDLFSYPSIEQFYFRNILLRIQSLMQKFSKRTF